MDKLMIRWFLLAMLCLSFALLLLGYRSTTTINTTDSRDLQNSDQKKFTQSRALQWSSDSGELTDLQNNDKRKFLQSRTRRWSSDKAFHKYLTSPDVICSQSQRVGKKTDGGWDVCLSSPYQLKAPCLVYSFGINYDFSFDDGIDKGFGCVVKSFDPSMTKVKSHHRGNNIHFFKYGIAGKDFKDNHGWELYSYFTLLKKMNDSNKVIDYLKMDIEWSEWEVLPDMAESGLLTNIKQIGIEIHRWKKGSVNAIHLINILEDYGFRKWKMEYNTNKESTYYLKDGTRTSQCMNLYYINTRFLNKDSIRPFLDVSY